MRRVYGKQCRARTLTACPAGRVTAFSSLCQCFLDSWPTDRSWRQLQRSILVVRIQRNISYEHDRSQQVSTGSFCFQHSAPTIATRQIFATAAAVTVLLFVSERCLASWLRFAVAMIFPEVVDGVSKGLRKKRIRHHTPTSIFGKPNIGGGVSNCFFRHPPA